MIYTAANVHQAFNGTSLPDVPDVYFFFSPPSELHFPSYSDKVKASTVSQGIQLVLMNVCQLYPDLWDITQ